MVDPTHRVLDPLLREVTAILSMMDSTLYTLGGDSSTTSGGPSTLGGSSHVIDGEPSTFGGGSSTMRGRPCNLGNSSSTTRDGPYTVGGGFYFIGEPSKMGGVDPLH